VKKQGRMHVPFRQLAAEENDKKKIEVSEFSSFCGAHQLGKSLITPKESTLYEGIERDQE